MDNGNIVPRITIEYYYQDSELIPLLTQLPDARATAGHK